MNTTPTNTADLRATLIEARDWFESQAKAVSKGCGSSYELHDLRVQRDALDAALAAPAQSAAQPATQAQDDAVAQAVAVEREACAQLAAQTVCDMHIPTGVKIYGARAAKAIRARGTDAAKPAAQALDSVRVFWQQHTQADALSMTMAELHADAERAIRAALAAPAQAEAPAHAARAAQAEPEDLSVAYFMGLHAENETLHVENDTLRAGYDAARLEIESLQAQAQQCGAGAGCCAQAARIEELEAQLEAVGAVPDGMTHREFGQFLSDVLTAAGLVSHGGQSKGLGQRLADAVMRLRAAPQPAAQAGWCDGCSPDNCGGCMTSAAPAQAQKDAKDAARYRFLRDGEWRDTALEMIIVLQRNSLWDSKIDAAIVAQQGDAARRRSMKKLSKKHIAHMQKMLSDREKAEVRFQLAWGDCIAGSLREMSKREIITLRAVLRYIAQQGESTDAS